ncbi:MAG TPA: ABC transporter substrate-binding protein [Acetobacteraceae bacterium]|nr:ABC transporter substrate-binding protein [Acetobacteraceae bacterium]
MIPIRRFPTRRQVLGGGLALGTLAAPFVRAQAAAPIRIGFPIPLTGPYQDEALDMLRGGRAAVATFNEQGGLGGQMAELLTRDDELNPATAMRVTRGLIENDHVNFITGGLSASVQLAINQVTKAAKVLFNSISQSDAIVAAPDWSPHTFHEALTPHMTSHAVGSYVFANYPRRIAFLVADYAFGNEIVAGFEAVGKHFGIEVVATVRHPLGTNDFRPYLEQIQAAKPNVLMLCNFGFDQRNSVQQADWMGLKKDIKLVTPVLDFTQRLALGSEAYQGILGGTSYYWRLEDTVPSARVFNNRFREMNDGRVPSDYGALGFAGVMTVLTAAKHANSVATDKLIAAMQGMKYDLYKGPEYYRTCDHQAVQSALVVDSRFTAIPNDMDVFAIVRIDPPSEAMLQSCAAEGHG